MERSLSSQEPEDQLSQLGGAQRQVKNEEDRGATESNEVFKFLEKCGMGKYFSLFDQNAISDLETLFEIKEEHLAPLKIPIGHRLRLMKYIRQKKVETPVKTVRVEHIASSYTKHAKMAEKHFCWFCYKLFDRSLSVYYKCKIFCSGECMAKYSEEYSSTCPCGKTFEPEEGIVNSRGSYCSSSCSVKNIVNFKTRPFNRHSQMIKNKQIDSKMSLRSNKDLSSIGSIKKIQIFSNRKIDQCSEFSQNQPVIRVIVKKKSNQSQIISKKHLTLRSESQNCTEFPTLNSSKHLLFPRDQSNAIVERKRNIKTDLGKYDAIEGW